MVAYVGQKGELCNLSILVAVAVIKYIKSVKPVIVVKVVFVARVALMVSCLVIFILLNRVLLVVAQVIIGVLELHYGRIAV